MGFPIYQKRYNGKALPTTTIDSHKAHHRSSIVVRRSLYESVKIGITSLRTNLPPGGIRLEGAMNLLLQIGGSDLPKEIQAVGHIRSYIEGAEIFTDRSFWQHQNGQVS